MLLKQRVAVRRQLRNVMGSLGFQVVRTRPVDLDPEDQEVLDRVRPFTMTSPERVATLCQAVRHTVDSEIPGAFVECGVWRGGSSMAVALTLLQRGIRDRELWLFDTFEGMSEPTEADVDISGTGADLMYLQHATDQGNDWCRAGIEDVRANMASTGYPMDRVHFVKGKVEDTLESNDTGPIALLRLDTDWYESTAEEMRVLYPRLAVGGPLVLDDYGFWKGSRKAVDEYFSEHGERPLLVRVDATGRVAVKLG